MSIFKGRHPDCLSIFRGFCRSFTCCAVFSFIVPDVYAGVRLRSVFTSNLSTRLNPWKHRKVKYVVWEYSYLIIDTRRCLSFQLGRHPCSLFIFLHTFLNISRLAFLNRGCWTSCSLPIWNHGSSSKPRLTISLHYWRCFKIIYTIVYGSHPIKQKSQ